MRTLLVTVALAALPIPAAAQAPATLDLPLSIDLARAAVDACAAKGAAVSASVVDDKGNPVVGLRAPASPKPPAVPVIVDAPDIEAVVARMARIPARQASSSDRDRLRTLEASLDRRG